MNRSRILAAVGIALVLTLTACGGDPEPEANAAATAPSPSKSAPPVDGGTYDSPVVLVDALSKAGINCANYEAIAEPTGAVARGSCYVGEEEWTIGIYASAADAREQPRMLAATLEGISDVNMVLGRNWTVGTHGKDWSDRVVRAVGGEVFHEPA